MKEKIFRYGTFLVCLLGMLSAFGPFLTDMYLPALPQLQACFSTDASMVQLSISTSMFGLAAGQIFFGPLSDKYGRRPIVIMLKEPDLFAGALLVAGKWKPELMEPLDKQNIWIISCEGDASSNGLQGQAVEQWRKQGSKVSEATWDMTLPVDKLSTEAGKINL